MITFRTNMGDFSIELDFDKAPLTAANFLQYARDDFYTGTIFHRVINGFMVQGGGMDENMNQKKTGAPVKNEANNGLKNDVGTVAMARTMDPHSASAQFFINHKSNGFLNPKGDNKGYAVFGAVVAGMNVVDAIAAVETQTLGYYADVPVKPIRILSARLLNPEAWKPLAEPKTLPAFVKTITIP